MATFNGDNYQKQYVTKPSEKIEKGEVAGRKRLLLEHKLLDSALAIGDEILCGFIPASSIVTGAKVVVPSLGATGIFDVGFKANGVDAVDADAFIVGADAGGQAVNLVDGIANVGIYKRFSKETQVFVTFTEAMDGSDLTQTIYIEIEYVND